MTQAYADNALNWTKGVPWHGEMSPSQNSPLCCSWPLVWEDKAAWTQRTALPATFKVYALLGSNHRVLRWCSHCRSWCPIGIFYKNPTLYVLVDITKTDVASDVNESIGEVTPVHKTNTSHGGSAVLSVVNMVTRVGGSFHFSTCNFLAPLPRC